jgi:hypothetical protein
VELLEDRNLLSVTPIDVIGNLPPAEYLKYVGNPDLINFLGEPNPKDWGNEPSVAVNPLNPNQIVISTFAYSGFIISPPGDTKASIWYSTDGGADWNIRFPVPAFPTATEGVPNDQTFAYDSNGVLHAAMLSFGLTANITNVFHGTTTDPNLDGEEGRPATVWQWNPNHVNLAAASQNEADQPWLALSGSHVFVGYDDFSRTYVSERVSASADGGATFTSDQLISNKGGLEGINPGTRLATDGLGNVYGLFATGEGPPGAPGYPQTVHYRLNESTDGGLSWKYTLSTTQGGLVVADGRSLQLGATFGGQNRLTGNITAVAADPSGAHVYAVVGLRDPSQTDRLVLKEFHPDPSGNLVERDDNVPIAFSVPGQRSALPSIAVTANGSLAVQYDTFTPGDRLFHVHLAISTDHGLTFSDQDIYDFTADDIPYPFTGGDRKLGDYQYMTAVGNTIYASFAGRGNVNNTVTGVNTTDKIDPFFYAVTLSGGAEGATLPATAGAAVLALPDHRDLASALLSGKLAKPVMTASTIRPKTGDGRSFASSSPTTSNTATTPLFAASGHSVKPAADAIGSVDPVLDDGFLLAYLG